MNTEAVKNEVNRIVEQKYTELRVKGWRFNSCTGKDLRQLEALGLSGMINRLYMKDQIVKSVLAAANDAGNKRVSVGGFNAYGEGDVTTYTTKPSTLYLLLNEKAE